MNFKVVQIENLNDYILKKKHMHHQEGRSAIPFDVKINDKTMDLLSPLGFANALYHTLNLKPGSGALSAPVCSTFVMV